MRGQVSSSVSLSNHDFSSPAYRRSRRAYSLQCAFEYIVSLLVADVFLAKLLGSLGIEDSVVGVISSFISLAFMIQLFSIFLYKFIIN